MGIIYLTIAFLPVLAGTVGVGAFIAYFALRSVKSRTYDILLIVGGVGVGIVILIFGAFFLIGLLGLGPVPN